MEDHGGSGTINEMGKHTRNSWMGHCTKNPIFMDWTFY